MAQVESQTSDRSRQPAVIARLLQMVLFRLFWGALLCVHLLVLISKAMLLDEVDLTAAPAAKLLFLLGAIVFFLLKVLDVPQLRFRNRRASAIAFLVIAGLVHREALVTVDQQIPLPLIAATSIVGLEVWRRRHIMPRGIRLLRSALPNHIRALSADFRNGCAWTSGYIYQSALLRCAPARAPPTAFQTRSR